MSRLLICTLMIGCLWACGPSLPSSVQVALDDIYERMDYNFDIQPILSEHCYPCHGPDAATREAELRLDTKEGVFSSSSQNADRIIEVGLPDRSELIARIFSTDPEVIMPPPDAKLELTPEKKAMLYRWIEEGVSWKPHWSYNDPLKVDLPEIKATEWPSNEIDHFVLKRMEDKNLTPSPKASAATLIRRASLDLVGLPPSLQELDDFLADRSEGAYEKMIDRLLRSPRFGEKWAWEWLDAARYADTNGFQNDPERKMWPWRDWVVNAINDNMPYDQFTIEQIAGDMLPDPTTNQILATAFNRNHMYNGEGGRIPEETRVENVFDRTETVGTLWLGLTFNCCRCHDHKFDQLTQEEYYAFSDFFNQTSEVGIGYNGRIKPVLDLSSKMDQQKVEEIEEFVRMRAAELDAYEKIIFPRPEDEPAAASPNAEDLEGDNLFALGFHPSDRNPYYLGLLSNAFKNRDAKYFDKISALRNAIRKKDKLTQDNLQVMVMDHLSRPRPTYVLDRGSYDRPLEQVQPGLPQIIAGNSLKKVRNRLDLAMWLISDQNPLMARVVVNRFWQSIFGTGIVKTPDDFGVQGEKPSHPQLLDWLARDFMENGWDVKRLIKKIMMSTTYRQSAKLNSNLLERDPDNVWLACRSRQRLPAWMIRDQALFISGLLSDSMGGPPVKPYQPPGVWEEATFGFKTYTQDHGEDLYRRTLYTFWRRIVGPTNLFDNSPRQTCQVKPLLTNTPMHALTTLNDVTYVEAARVMAARVMHSFQSVDDQLVMAFRMATSRHPSVIEKNILFERFEILKNKYQQKASDAKELISAGEYPTDQTLDQASLAAMAGICSLILNLDEVISQQ